MSPGLVLHYPTTHSEHTNPTLNRLSNMRDLNLLISLFSIFNCKFYYERVAGGHSTTSAQAQARLDPSSIRLASTKHPLVEDVS